MEVEEGQTNSFIFNLSIQRIWYTESEYWKFNRSDYFGLVFLSDFMWEIIQENLIRETNYKYLILIHELFGTKTVQEYFYKNYLHEWIMDRKIV